MVVIEMENGGVIKLELDATAAPNTVRNWSLSRWLATARCSLVISSLAIQGGCPQGTGMGGPGYQIRENYPHCFPQSLRHDRADPRSLPIRIPPAPSSSSCTRTAISWMANTLPLAR